MTVQTECPHSDFMTPATCSICLHGPSLPTKARHALRSIEARHHGKCAANCGDPIDIGDEIVLVGTDEDHASWFHFICSEDELS